MLPKTKSRRAMTNNKYFETFYKWFHETKTIGEFGKACAEIQEAFSEAIASYGYGVERDTYALGYTDGVTSTENEGEIK